MDRHRVLLLFQFYSANLTHKQKQNQLFSFLVLITAKKKEKQSLTSV